MDREEFGWLVRGILAGSVFLVAFTAFQMGVGVSARSELPELGFLAHVYYSAGLFILGGMDLGTPVGGPPLARSLLWSAYFLAPVITTSAVVEGLRFLGNGAVERFGMRRHLIVAGLGKLGMNFVTASRRWDTRVLIVALDRDVNRAAVTQARRLSHMRFLPADIQLPGAFHHLALKRARAVVLLTDNDLLNLEMAFHLVQSHPGLRVIAHCSDLALERLLADAWEAAARGRIHVFNSHRAAAQHLYEHHLRAHFAHTPDRDTVILAGFGRFAQTILEFLGQESQDEIERVLIAGPAASLGLRKFRSQVQPSELLEAKPFDGDLMDPDTWQAVARELGGSIVPPTVLLASDDVSANLQSALLARRRWPDSRIFVRCQDESSFADELAVAHQFTLLPVDSLLREALFLAHFTWFGEDATSSRGESPSPSSRERTHQLASSGPPQ